MSITIVEKHPGNKERVLAVRPYFDDAVTNMGLEKYGMVLFPGVYHEEPLACIDHNGIKRYVTGLNEFAPDVKVLPETEKKAKIGEIRKTIAILEKDLAANVIDVKDDDFWNKVKLLRPDNSEFWDKIKIRCGNEPTFLDPKEPYDMIRIIAVRNGGFSMISKSYEEARTRPVAPKFYLDEAHHTASAKTEYKKIKNKAISTLDRLFSEDMNKLFYICKVVDANSVQYIKSTPHDILYDNMDRYINGEGIEKNMRRAALTFTETASMDMETLKIKSIIKDAAYYKLISLRGDGFMYHTDTSTLLGRNVPDVIEFLRNPINDSIFMSLLKKMDKEWNR